MRRTSRRRSSRAGSAAAGVALVGLLSVFGIVSAPLAWATSGWERVPHSEAVFGGSANQGMLAVASTTSGFVAVGTDSSLTAAAVWFSADGIAWTRATHTEGVFGGPDSQTIHDVAQGLGNANGPGNVVAVGSSGPAGGQDAAVWTGGGNTWKRVKHDAVVFGGTGMQVMRAVAGAGPGVVAVGHDFSGGDHDAAVWTSEAGTIWTRVPHNEAVLGGYDGQLMLGVIAGGPGVVAVGRDLGLGAAAVWTSTDGTSWTRVPHNEAVFGGPAFQGMTAVTAGGPGLVAVGADYDGGDVDAAVWTSKNGITWTRVAHDEAVFGGPGDQEMFDVVAGGPGLIAVGFENDGVDRDAAVWTSPDGLTWTRVPHDEATFGGVLTETMNSIAVDGTGFGVAVGYQWDSALYDEDAAVWTYSPSSAPPPPPASTAPAPSATAGTTPAATATASPAETAGPSPSATPAGSSGGSVGWYVGGGFALLAIASGILGWALARRRV